MADKRYVFPTERLVRYEFPTHINDLVMDRAEAETSEAFIVIVEPDKGAPVHVHHDTEQVFYVLEGTGELRVGQEDAAFFPVKPGDLCRIPPHTYHTIRCTSAEPLRYLAVDCFMGGRPAAEPTWDSHVKVNCEMNGWDFSKVKK